MLTLQQVQQLEVRLELARQVPGSTARVPAIWVGGQLILGYSEEARTDRLVRSALAGQKAAHDPAAAAIGTCAAEDESAMTCAADATEEKFEISVLGRTLSLDDVGLPAFAVVMGLLDGFNPCSMWVLILMISLIWTLICALIFEPALLGPPDREPEEGPLAPL